MDDLSLRRMRESDFEAFHTMVSDYDVVKMTMSWPWPPEPAFTRMRMQTEEVKSGSALAIDAGGQFAGQIALVRGEIGYMLARPFWGRGIATWAAREMLVRGFANPEVNTIKAGTWEDNPASMAILRKCGFQKTGEAMVFCKPRGKEVNGPDFALSRADWANGRAYRIETERLIIEPLTPLDKADFARVMDDPNVTWMMGSISSPFAAADAEKWIKARVGAGKSGRIAKVLLKDGTMIGHLRLSVGRLAMDAQDVSLGYAFGSAFAGQGFATEATHPFLAQGVADYALKHVSAAVMADNPASIRLLEKLGFQKTGERMHLVTGRLEKAPLFLYRLACTHRTLS